VFVSGLVLRRLEPANEESGSPMISAADVGALAHPATASSTRPSTSSVTSVLLISSAQARGVPETGRWSCCAFVFVDQAAEDIAAVDLFGGWRSRYGLAL